jgi:hypothetical protein
VAAHRSLAIPRYRAHGDDGVVSIIGGEVSVDLLDHCHATVPEDGGQLHGVHPATQCLGGKRVPEEVGVNASRHPRAAGHPPDHLPNSGWGETTKPSVALVL